MARKRIILRSKKELGPAEYQSMSKWAKANGFTVHGKVSTGRQSLFEKRRYYAEAQRRHRAKVRKLRTGAFGSTY